RAASPGCAGAAAAARAGRPGAGDAVLLGRCRCGTDPRLLEGAARWRLRRAFPSQALPKRALPDGASRLTRQRLNRLRLTWQRLIPHDPRPPRPRSSARALALHGPLRAPPARLVGEHRSGLRGAARGLDRRPHARSGRWTELGRLSALVGAGRGSHQGRAAGAVVRAAALRGALLPLPVVAPERGEARAAGPHPRSQLRAYGDARAPTARDRDRPRPDAGDRATLADRRL